MNRTVAFCMAAVLATAGCAYRTMTIKSLLDDPSRYNGKKVQVSGETKQGQGALGYGEYQLDDGTGTLTVLTQHNGAPRKGAAVKVQGTFRAVATVGSRSVAVLEEKKRVD